MLWCGFRPALLALKAAQWYHRIWETLAPGAATVCRNQFFPSTVAWYCMLDNLRLLSCDVMRKIRKLRIDLTKLNLQWWGAANQFVHPGRFGR
jgi:hypothetical protein